MGKLMLRFACGSNTHSMTIPVDSLSFCSQSVSSVQTDCSPLVSNADEITNRCNVFLRNSVFGLLAEVIVNYCRCPIAGESTCAAGIVPKVEA